MATNFYTLAVKKIEKETNESVVITFDLPKELSHTFEYLHGQYLTLRATINGQDVRRSYSICSSPFDKNMSVAIKKVTQGIFSTYANDVLKKGDTLQVMPPNGKFNTPLHQLQQKKYVAIACGSGITPILSIIKTTLLAEPKSTFTLLYSNKTRSSIMFFEALEALKNKFVARLTIIQLLSREKTDIPLLYGRIDTDKLTSFKKIIDYNNIDEYYICGPENMILDTKKFLVDNCISPKKIHFELFASSTPKLPIIATTLTDNAIAKSTISLKLDGRTTTFKLATNGNSILDEAMQQGADLPYACKGGMCCTCKAKLISGKVTMDVNYALEDEELEQGYILTCQAHPITPDVSIDFDAN